MAWGPVSLLSVFQPQLLRSSLLAQHTHTPVHAHAHEYRHGRPLISPLYQGGARVEELASLSHSQPSAQESRGTEWDSVWVEEGVDRLGATTIRMEL